MRIVAAIDDAKNQQVTDSAPMAKLSRRFEVAVVVAVELLLVIAVAVAVVLLYIMFVHGVRANLTAIESVDVLEEKLGRIFAGVLVVLLGLELIETLKAYFVEHHVRTELILTVALIAIGRHLIQIDVAHAGGGQLAGIAALILSLAAGLFVIRRSHAPSGSGDASTTGSGPEIRRADQRT
jgi:uncharacterized membrane protein (DUF373 family)